MGASLDGGGVRGKELQRVAPPPPTLSFRFRVEG